MFKFISRKAAFPVNDPRCIEQCMQFIRTELKTAKVEGRHAIRAQLLSEEMLATLIANAPDGEVRVSIKKTFGDTSINISTKGDEIDLYGYETDISGDLDDEEAEAAFRAIILKSHGENFKYGHKNGINNVRIMTGKAQISSIRLTLGALVLGIVFGLFIKFVLPEAACTGICDYLLTPFSTVFMNALKMVIAPVVFFSIVSCISGFGDLSELKRIGVRVMLMYLLTTVLAVLMAFVVTNLISPGEFGAALAMTGTQAVEVNTDVDTSILTTIINIVPSNFIRPFLEADTLQLIFLAIIIGIAVGKIGEYTPVLCEFFEACNSLFLTLTSMIAKFIPVAVFCSISLMFVNLGGSSFLSMAGYFLTNVLEIIIMLFIYGLLILIIARLNPITFFKKNREGMVTSFTLSSSTASMPINIKTCTDKLGISPKVANFSIPLGATINMDGTCISLVLSGLYLAKMYGVTVPVSMMGPLALTIILLSLGCPGVPGVGLVCLGIVLQQIGVPIGAMGLILAIDPVLDMFDTMSNTTGDVSCALITAKKEGLLDMDIYNDMSRS
ncbi:MAG: dicarboxylate/amino acid:cation symporter [Clostridiales bacterium]|jgi:Na+/H+-dicarboxylate symporter|nr:dicarboxylate/amino acid:cation symporter [Clostridiales bacterium]